VIDGFRYSERLVEVVIPNSVECLGSDTFSDCDRLVNVVLPLDGKLSILRGFSAIPITEIRIPDSIELIEGLSECWALKNVVFGPGSKLRVVHGFEKCEFVEIQLPDSVEIVGSYGFESEKFRVIKIGEKSKLKTIDRRFRNHSLKLFLEAPELWLSNARQRLNLRLSHGQGQMISKPLRGKRRIRSLSLAT
jgi:hypothetical protein